MKRNILHWNDGKTLLEEITVQWHIHILYKITTYYKYCPEIGEV